jgi:hypothetical protein
MLKMLINWESVNLKTMLSFDGLYRAPHFFVDIHLKMLYSMSMNNKILKLVKVRIGLVLLYPIVFLLDLLLLKTSYKSWEWTRRESRGIFMFKWNEAKK